MSFISFNQKNNEHSAISIIFFITSLFLLITKVNCASSNISEINNYDKIMHRYHQAIFNFTGLSKKMETIKFNMFLIIDFKELSKLYDELKEEMIKLKKIHEKNESISNIIDLIDKNLKKFQKKYKKILKTYNRFDDVKKVIKHMLKVFIIVLSIIIGISIIGIGIGMGEDRAVEAAKQAVNSPLLETTINGATDCIVNITGGNSMTLFEAEDAVEVVRAVANTDVNIIFGAVINEALTDEIVVTVIATGFEDSTEPLYRSIEGEKKQPEPVVQEEEEEELEMPAFLRNRD
jgi:cell division GTPase FtsZ